MNNFSAITQLCRMNAKSIGERDNRTTADVRPSEPCYKSRDFTFFFNDPQKEEIGYLIDGDKKRFVYTDRITGSQWREDLIPYILFPNQEVALYEQPERERPKQEKPEQAWPILGKELSKKNRSLLVDQPSSPGAINLGPNLQTPGQN